MEPFSSPAGHLDMGRPAEKVTVPAVRAMPHACRKITAVTAYDALTAAIVDAAGVDVVLVGDSLANTALGYENTLGVSIDEMLSAVRAVRRGVRSALVVGDMPFGSYQASEDDAVRNAVRFIQAGAEAVKLEGGRHREVLVQRLVENGIPVMGHIGLTPQSVHAMGGYKVQGRREEDAERLVEDALALERAGAFSIVLEGMPSALAARITRELGVPSIGIGAGADCHGQILVLADLLGLSGGRPPKFVRRYASLRETAIEAVSRYAQDVREGAFPRPEESYGGARSQPLAAPRSSGKPVAL